MPDYKSNMGDVIRNLTIDLKTTTDPNKLSRVGAEQLIGDMIRRIHYEGLSGNGGLIGNYSTEPIYVSLNAFVRKKGKVVKSATGKPIGGGKILRGKGKNSESDVFDNGKKRKSRYFEQGYLEYHDEMGNGTKVNLTLTGQLSNDLQVAPAGKYFGLGFSQYGMRIYPGLENHFNVFIWIPTNDEKDRVMVALEDYIERNLKK